MRNGYTSLKGHEAEFNRGWPILMYHKLGVPSREVKIRGLFVSVDLFTQQLQEWKEHGKPWRSLGALLDSPGLTVTFDDGFANVLRLGLEPMREVGCTAMQFLVAGLLGKNNEWDLIHDEVQEPLMDDIQVKEWLAAGHEIGAHTMTHPHLTQIPLAQAREEIFTSKKSLEDRFGVPIRHFAYPYGDYNEPVQELVREAGFETACTTKPGVNRPGQDPLQLKRFMARHISRKLFKPWTWF